VPDRVFTLVDQDRGDREGDDENAQDQDDHHL